MATSIPAPPVENQDPWFTTRDAFDTAVRTRLNDELSDSDIQQMVLANAPAPLARSTSGAVAPLTYVNVADFGAVAGSMTNQAPAFQAAIDAAGSSGVVRVPKGVYHFSSGITLPAWGTLEGEVGPFATGGTSPIELRFSATTGAGVTMGVYSVLRSIMVRGAGSNAGDFVGVSGGSVTLEHVEIANCKVGLALLNAYYAVVSRSGFNRNATAISLVGCYNVNIFAPRIYGWGTDNTLGNGISGAARPLNIFGGSFENVRHGVSMLNAQQTNLYGVYFENIIPEGQTWPTGIFHGVLARDRSNVTVNAVGCMVYINQMTSFITTLNSSNVALNGKGNTFSAGVASVTTPNGYEVSHGQAVDIGGDNWSEVNKAGAVHVSVAGGLPVRGGAVESLGRFYEGRTPVTPVQTITHSAAGAVTIDTAVYTKAIINLSANLTGITLSNPKQGEEVLLMIRQDATGGKTYVYPSNARFAGGAAPSDTTANTMTTVRLVYDGEHGRWREVSRSVAVAP